MSYVEATGYLPGGTMLFTVRWEDGVWSGDEPILDLIEQAKAQGPVAVTATGPFVPADTPRAAALLAPGIFERVESFKTNIRLKLKALPKGAVA